MRSGIRAATVAATVLLALLAPGKLREPASQEPEQGVAPEAPTLEKPEAPSWSQAAERVKEDRGEPMGRRAVLAIPPELVHARDRKRFLAVQVASWREDGFDRPEDSLELAELVGAGELVPVPVLGEHHILFGVGGHVEDSPFTVRTAFGEVPLSGTVEKALSEADALEKNAQELMGRVADVRKKAAALPRKARTQATRMRRSATDLEKQARASRAQATALRVAYADPANAERLLKRHQALASVASTLGPRPYDLDVPADRAAFRGRLMTTLRQPAIDMVLQVARGYAERFSRPLPVSSLIRTEAYQRRLSRSNPNATLIDIAPHTTGLAFDVYDGRMSAAEQRYLLSEFARLEREGKLEALRENRDHVHVFVFPSGTPPAASAVAAESRRLHAGEGRSRTASVKSSSSRSRTARAAPKTTKRRSATAKRR
jgi:hypothetical protein